MYKGSSGLGSNPAKAEQIARTWTSVLMKSFGEDVADPAELSIPASPSPAVDLTDVGTVVLRFGRQLRSVQEVKREVPVLVEPSSGTAMAVDLDASAGAGMSVAEVGADRWLAEAGDRINQLADASSLSYRELPIDVVTSVVQAATVELVASRVLTGWIGGGTKVSLYPVRVHTTAPGLRVHYSLNIVWNPVYYGAPSPTVSGKLQAGRYQFGVDGPGRPMTQDPAVFDVPQIQDAHLSVA